MDIAMMLQGLVVGFLISAPVGALGLLCVQNTIIYGMAYGCVFGLGAATGDMIYGILIASGMQKLTTIFAKFQGPISLLGGLFLIYLGLQKIWEKPIFRVTPIVHLEYLRVYFLTFVLTVMNPATFLEITALFAGFGINVVDYTQALSFVAGVFIGSVAWWFLLSGLVTMFRSQVSIPMLKSLNCVVGIVTCCFGLWALKSILIVLLG